MKTQGQHSYWRWLTRRSFPKTHLHPMESFTRAWQWLWEKRVQTSRSKALDWIRYDPNYSHDTTCKEKNDIIPNVASDDLNHRMINYICRYIYATKSHNQNHSTPSSRLARSDRRISQCMHRQIPSDTCMSILDDIVQRLLHVSTGQNRQHVDKGFGMFQLDTKPWRWNVFHNIE